MRIKVDLESDALYFRVCDAPIEESEEVAPGVIIDYDEKGRAVGVELLGIRERFPLEELRRLTVEMPTTVS